MSIITGGLTDTPKFGQNWYFNHASQEFQSGPNLLEARVWHTSASITDQETKEKILIVVGGYSEHNVSSRFLDRTEILSNGEWVAGINHKQLLYLSNYKGLSFLKLGPALPKVLLYHSMVEVGENLYAIGGYSTDGLFQNEIQKLTCTSGACSWTTLTQQLKVHRMSAVAIPIMDSFCNPN